MNIPREHSARERFAPGRSEGFDANDVHDLGAANGRSQAAGLFRRSAAFGAPRAGVLNALTFDVEEFFQVHAFQGVVSRTEWDHFPSRVEESTRRILTVLRDGGVQATFFVLGWVADRRPELVREIEAQGHEIATHGYWHELIYRGDRETFREDLTRSIEAIESALGHRPPLGYRAPGFSITNDSLWALEVLNDCGIIYDSSIFPLSFHDRYGIPTANRFAHQVGGGLWEFPVSTIRFLERNWPVAGGGYFRLYPFRATCRAIQRINGEGNPAVVYLHPWEFDPQQPRIRQAPALSRFRHYVNLAKTEHRLRSLLERFDFGPLRDAFRDCLASNPSPGRKLHPSAEQPNNVKDPTCPQPVDRDSAARKV